MQPVAIQTMKTVIQEYLIETLDSEGGHITILRNVRTSRLAVLKSVKTLI